MLEGDKYCMDAKSLIVPEGVSARDFVFNNARGDMLLETNHHDQLVVVKGENRLVDLPYVVVKQELRKSYKGKTIFVVIEDVECVCRPAGDITIQNEWIVGVTEKSIYFVGDGPRQEFFDAEKIVEMVRIGVLSAGEKMTLLVVVKDEEERRFFKELIGLRDDYTLKVKGMEMWVKGSKREMKKEIFVTELQVVNEDYSAVREFVGNVNSVNDVMVWKDLSTDTLVPSELEASVILSSLIFSFEGFAAINLFVIGPPGCGKSFMLDQFGNLLGIGVHACGETTAKGLVYSHMEGGRPGVLYREKFVALLNEFIRLFTRSKLDKSREAEELFSALNDAVEKKPNRKRSSGYVSDAEARMVCSMITSDNDYEPKIAPFADALLSDPSYMRRYSILVLEEGTKKRGMEAKTKAVEWRHATEMSLRKRGLSGKRWVTLVKFWRSQVKEAIKRFQGDFTEFALFANEHRTKVVNKVIYGSQRGQLILGDDQGEDASVKNFWRQLNEADFMQMGVACVVCAGILGSTFRAKEGMPELELMESDKELAKSMIMRLIDDEFRLLEPYISKRMVGGVRRW